MLDNICGPSVVIYLFHIHGHYYFLFGILVLRGLELAFCQLKNSGRLFIVKPQTNTPSVTDLSTVSIKIPQIGKYPVYYNSNNQSFPPIFICAILSYKNVAIFRDIFVNIIVFRDMTLGMSPSNPIYLFSFSPACNLSLLHPTE